MSSTNTYRIRMRSCADASAVCEAMLPTSFLPIHEAREVNLDWYMGRPALIGRDGTFSAQIPTDQPKGPQYWSFDGETFTVCVDLVNPRARHDDLPTMEHGEPSRLSVLLDAVSSICGEPDGTIVGGWQSEHLDGWMPLVVFGGRVMQGFPKGTCMDDRHEPTLVQNPRQIDLALIEDASGDHSLSIRAA